MNSIIYMIPVFLSKLALLARALEAFIIVPNTLHF